MRSGLNNFINFNPKNSQRPALLQTNVASMILTDTS